jgi:hypothetical protein
MEAPWHVPKHQDPAQFQAAGHGRRDPGIFTAVRQEIERLLETVEGARAVDEVAQAARALLDALVTNAPPRDREAEASKARARGVDRFRARDPRQAS